MVLINSKGLGGQLFDLHGGVAYGFERISIGSNALLMDSNSFLQGR